MAWRASRVRYADVLRLRDELGLPDPVAWTLVRRGWSDPEAAREFLRADGPLAPPDAIEAAPAAAERLMRAVADRERIVVHGDYDCDGVTSTALMLAAVEARGGDVRGFLPDRFEDGYGVSEATVRRLAEEGCDLLVCVDCGTTAVDELTLAAELGMDVIVCDHHLAAGRRPPGIIVNPALGAPRDDLPAAAGVVFAVTRSMVALDAGGLGPSEEAGIDLVALATVADAVPLVGENRRLVARGLAALRAAPRAGIAALAGAAGSDPRAMTARGLGFTLAPAINAAGRMTHADEALRLLRAGDPGEARPLAERLWGLNEERREVERRIVEEAVAIVEAEPPERREADALVVAGDGWHQGVVGIVASRLVDRFERPAIVLTREGGVAKGSGRSLPGVDLHSLVLGAEEGLTRWGGHAGAVGLELPAGEVEAFRARLAAAAAGQRRAIERARVREVDAVVGVRDLALPVAEAMEALAPFGRGNPQPSLAVPAARLEGVAGVGNGEHLRVRLRAGGAHARAIAFRWGRRRDELAAGERYDAVVRLGVDRWQDTVGPRVELERLEPLAQRPETPPYAADQDSPGPLLGDGAVEAPPASVGRPLSVDDRRGLGAALPTLAALAGADRGVVALVADARRRAPVLAGVLEPGRLGAEGAIVGPDDDGSGLDRAARRGAVVALVGYDALPRVPLPDGVHVVVLDPPRDPDQLGWLRHRAAGRHLHLVYGPEEVAVAVDVAEAELDPRPAAVALWRAIGAAGGRVELDDDGRRRLAEAVAPASAAAASRALRALVEIGQVEHEAGAVRIAAGVRGSLDDAPAAKAARERLEAARRFLGTAATLDIAGAVEGRVATDAQGALALVHDRFGG